MRIAVIGALGRVGSRVLAEARARGHEVTAVVRRATQLDVVPSGVRGLTADASDTDALARVTAEHDLVVLATRSRHASVDDTVAVMKAALAAARRTDARLLVVGGAAPLRSPRGGLVLDDERYLPAEWRAVGEASAAQREVCLGEERADWAYLCPPADLAPGERTGVYRRGHDTLLVDAQGRSCISMEDLAVALLDEAERPTHRRASFTVAY